MFILELVQYNEFLMKLNNETVSIELKNGTYVQGTIISGINPGTVDHLSVSNNILDESLNLDTLVIEEAPRVKLNKEKE
ncbi:hypothetical protein MKX03_024039, partial [Papaver bracteatum]